MSGFLPWQLTMAGCDMAFPICADDLQLRGFSPRLRPLYGWAVEGSDGRDVRHRAARADDPAPLPRRQRWRRSTSGPPERAVDIIFSHANGFNARTYRTILQPLAGDLRILAIDLRGHGASSLPTVIEGRQGWMEFRDDLLALLAVA